jgi:hypothetical protein
MQNVMLTLKTGYDLWRPFINHKSRALKKIDIQKHTDNCKYTGILGCATKIP